MEYIVRIIGVRSDAAKLFYISNSLQDWITGCRADAAIYYTPEFARCAIEQGIESIKRDLDERYHFELEGIQIIKRVVTEEVVQTLKSSDV